MKPRVLLLRDALACRGSSGITAAVGHRIGQPEVLFRLIDDQEILKLRDRFAGSQADQRSRRCRQVQCTGRLIRAGVPGYVAA